MKTIYFIRHGQSTGNASLWNQQGEHTALTSYGHEQAKRVARHVKKLPLEALISSTFARAKATAEEISKETGLPITFSEIFVERRRPSVQLRKKKAHPSWLIAQLNLMLHSRKSTYRHSDEETPEELLARAHTALQLLATRPESEVAVVTHGHFMRALHAVITYGEGVPGSVYLRAARWMPMHNTALMVATLDEGKWGVKAWNVDAATL